VLESNQIEQSVTIQIGWMNMTPKIRWKEFFFSWQMDLLFFDKPSFLLGSRKTKMDKD